MLNRGRCRELEVFKSDSSPKQIQVIAVTANTMPREIACVRAAGYTGCFTKPIDFRSFLAVVEKTMEPPTAS